MENSYRIHTNISNDTVLQVNMKQDFDFLEVLSLKLRQKDAYRIHSSNYGVIVGRVLANDAFGIPNAKVSVFIERDENDSSDIEAIYPYKDAMSNDKYGRRYNLLPDDSDDDCYRIVGTFPSKRLVLDDNMQLEVYDKYWKYTTVSNNAGDYMIFGVPTGSVTVHVDIDLSDIGILSQKPRDFEYKGYTLSMFDSSSQFKSSTNLDGLAQLFSQNKGVFVYPFWGDESNGIAVITRSDIQIQYKFEPTCVFMGSIVSDNEGHAIGHKCAPDVENGMNNQLVGGSGTIEMIRKTSDGLVEEYQIQGNQLIDEDGVWCYQIPMNLDYIGTDEYGNIVPTDNPNKGIPTRTQVRFRISKNETLDEGFSRHTAKYLVPMNPVLSEEQDDTVPKSLEDGHMIERMYSFGSSTPISCFRDLYWNNVYSVKNYIPKTQVARRAYSQNYSALKGSNLADDQNPIPFNKLRIDMPFLYMVVCLIYTIMVWVVTVVNGILSFLHFIVYELCIRIPIIRVKICPFRPLGWILGDLTCISLSPGGDEGNIAYYPGCLKGAMKDSSCPSDMEDGCQKSNDQEPLVDKIQRNLALEFKIVKLDFYQDWLNGCLYMPLWYWRKRQKKSFLFGLFKNRARNDYCSDSRTYSRLKTKHTCNITYEDTSFNTKNERNYMPDSEKRWHKRKIGVVYYNRGLIKQVENKDGLLVYYYACGQATSENKDNKLEMSERDAGFNIFQLYATDIILLGNLDPNNIYGIPQFYKCLPSTTANVPPIATIEEESDGEENDEIRGDMGEEEDSGTTITTGMDWNNDGNEQSPMYKTGLFMDLACTYAATRPKSCINVERLSELGVSLDMTQRMAYGKGNGIVYGQFESDGFINKLDLEDEENRSMFATLNHIGFIPQEYQESIGGYTTQVMDINTNYLVPKFKYIYPVDFDGRLSSPMELYRNGSVQALEDVTDESYITFRTGAESNKNKSENSEGRIRHFYHADSGKFSMPLYNNSYYFYFGIKKGSTAIDKFNKMFDAPCHKNEKKPFSLVIESRGMSYCPDAYASDKKNNAYAYIKVSSDDIRTPYTYILYDSFNNIIITEDGMTADTFVIGGYIGDDGKVKVNDNGIIKYQISGEELNDVTLKNQVYKVELIDSEGKRLSEKVELEMPYISGEFQTMPLGTKFIDTTETKMNYICDKNNQFYGTITISSVTIDGRDCTITNVSAITSNNNTYSFDLTLKSEEYINAVLHAILYLESVVKSETTATTEATTEECMCKVSSLTVKPWEYSNGVLTFNIYQPNDFVMTLAQGCTSTSEISDENRSSVVVSVKNGEPFEAYLNGMPLRFMLGTSSDDINATTSNKSHFYSSTVITAATNSERINGWYGVHQEEAYKFPDVDEDNAKIWRTFLKNTIDDITSVKTKLSIANYKFQKMFSLSDGVYFTDESSKRFKYTATGGVSPILYRSFTPLYKNTQKLTQGMYVFSDNASIPLSDNMPNIVTSNYYDNPRSKLSDGAHFNDKFGFYPYLGNYFAAFTKDGGYVSSRKVDNKISFEKRPVFTVVNPDATKQKGKDIEMQMDMRGPYSKIHTASNTSQPYLRALSVDRRLDYDLTILAPAIESDFTLYGISREREMSPFWKGGRIFGTVLNGIEMSYDNDYNIISGDVGYDSVGIVSGVTANTRLEYSYSASSSDARPAIIYHSGATESVWPDDVDNNKMIIKRFYSADMNGKDIRNMFWSNFNKENLKNNGGKSHSGDTTYIYAYPSGATDLYNGDFNIWSVSGDASQSYIPNYPTKRYIDVAKLPQSSYFSFNLASCSYGVKPALNDDGTIGCEADEGETMDFEANFGRPITIISPEGDENNYYNLNYVFKSRGAVTSVDLSASTAGLYFKYNEFTVDNFIVHTKTPKIIKVLPYTIVDSVNYDGISLIKTAHESGDNDIGQKISIDRLIKDRIGDYDNSVYLAGVRHGRGWGIYDINVSLPDGISVQMDYYPTGGSHVIGDCFFYINDSNEYLPSDDSRFGQIKFSTSFPIGTSVETIQDSFGNVINISTRNDVMAFAVLTDREYMSEDDDYLTKHIRTIEMSEIFDCRDLRLEVDTDHTYGQRFSALTDTVSSENNEGNETEEYYIQHMGFKFVFNDILSDNVLEKHNEAFAQSDLMTYVVVYEDRNGNKYTVAPSVTVTKTYVYKNEDDTYRFAYCIINDNTVYTTNGDVPDWVRPLNVPINIDGLEVNKKGNVIYRYNSGQMSVIVDYEGFQVDQENDFIYDESGNKIYYGSGTTNEEARPYYKLTDNGNIYINSNSQLVDSSNLGEDGHLVNENGFYVDENGYQVDEDGRLTNNVRGYKDIDGREVDPVYVDNNGYWIKWNGMSSGYVHAVDDIYGKQEVLVDGDGYWIDENGKFMGDFSHLVDGDGYWVDEDGHFLATKDQLTVRVNDEGNWVDLDGNIILVDLDGNIVLEGGQPYYIGKVYIGKKNVPNTMVGKKYIGKPEPKEAYLSSVTIALDCKWDVEMGLLKDGQWGYKSPLSYGKCKIMAKSPSGFVYQVYNFMFEGREDYYPNDENWVYGEKYYNYDFKIQQIYGW